MYLISSSNSRQVYRDLFYIGISWFIAKLNGLTIALFSNTKPSCLENCQHCTFCLALSQNLKISKKDFMCEGFKKKSTFAIFCTFLGNWLGIIILILPRLLLSTLPWNSVQSPPSSCMFWLDYILLHSLIGLVLDFSL